MEQLSFITLFMLLLSVSLVSSKQCYFLDGTDASANGKICQPNSDVSSCCATTDSCLTSGLCLSPNGLIYQFGCTDQEGKSCPVVCPTPQNNWNGGKSPFWSIYPCDPVTATFCCRVGNSGSCCNSSTAPIVKGLNVGTPVQVSGNSSNGSNTTAAPASCTSGSDKTCSGVTIGAAAGIGIGLGVLLLGALALVALLLNQRRRLNQQSVEKPGPSNYQAHPHTAGFPHQPAELDSREKVAELEE